MAFTQLTMYSWTNVSSLSFHGIYGSLDFTYLYHFGFWPAIPGEMKAPQRQRPYHFSSSEYN